MGDVVIRIQGGIGNQMFQYAIGKELEYLGQNVKYDFESYKRGYDPFEYELKDTFGLVLPEASFEEVKKAQGGGWLERTIRKYINKQILYEERNEMVIQPREVITKGYLNGYWQSEDFFMDVSEELKKDFDYQKKIHNRNVLKEIVGGRETVAIHIRLGDYKNHKEEFENICGVSYYKKAISIMLESLDNPVFYLFSDEPDVAREKIGYDCVTVNSDSSTEDLFLMSQCKHNIIANSTYSWWASWLNSNPQKIVIAPKMWNNLWSNERQKLILSRKDFYLI